MAITAERLQVDVGGDTSEAREALQDLEDEGAKIPDWVGAASGALAGLFTGAALAGGAAFTAGLMANMDAADATAKVTAQLGLTTTEAERVGGVAGDLFADAYGESLADTNAAVAAVVSSVDGMRTASAPILEAATADVINFATAFETDVERAAQVAGQAVRQGLAPDFASAMDLMTAASQQVPAAVRGDLLDAVDEYGGFFTQLGMSGEAGFAALARGAGEGMIGIDKTGDALKELTIRATDGSALTVGAYEAMGLSAADMSNAILAGGDTAAGAFDQIVSGLLGIEDPTERANQAIALFGSPLEDLGTAGIPAFLTSMQNLGDGLGDTASSAEDMGAAINSGPGVALETFKRQAQDAFMGLSDWALPPLMELAAVASENVGPAITGTAAALGTAAGFVREHSTAFGIAAGVLLAVFLPAIIAAGVQSTITTAKVVAGWVVQNAAAIAGAAAQWGAVARVVAGWVLMGAQSLIQAARMAGAWLIAMGPVGWVIAAVIGLVALIVANWDTISRVTAQVWTAIVGWVTGAWESIVSWVTGAVDKVRSAIATGFAVVVTLVTMYVNAWRTIIATVWNAIVAVVNAAIRGVKATIEGLASIAGRVGQFFGAVRDAIQERLSQAVEFVRGIPGKIVDALSAAVGLMRTAGGNIIGGLVDGIRGAISRVTSAVGDVMQAARDFLPFSPARRGPFSGRGWSRFSGEAIVADLAGGMDRNVNLLKRSALNVATVASSALAGASGTGFAGTSSASSRATAQGSLGLAQGGDGGPSSLVVVDADGVLRGMMRVEAGQVANGRVTPLDEGRARW